MDSAQLSGNVNYENDIQPPGQVPAGSPYEAIKTAMNINFDVFREPRGVMRILQFVFSICAFATTTGYTNEVTLSCKNMTETVVLDFDYPFKLDYVIEDLPPRCSAHPLRLYGNFSSDAQFFVATGVLSLLYCVAIVLVYVMLDAMYQSNGLLPLTDFILTTILAVFWLSGSAAWANGLTGLKTATSPNNLISIYNKKVYTVDTVSVGNYSGLNISVILGFLNFFLWASDLWFLYKETPWFKMKQSTSGTMTAA
ncbi:synaptophysin isoform X2 [Anabrus simplex]|uniref:synaptophysin isoform X2 n=1 Tax=Anabrus simplex TaxID=316456 RepID=UPI0034DD5EF6